MFRSASIRLIAALAIGLSAAASIAVDAAAYCVTAVSRGARWLFESVMPAPMPLIAEPGAQTLPRVQLVRAIAFKLRRMVRREHIEIRPGYRLCPAI